MLNAVTNLRDKHVNKLRKLTRGSDSPTKTVFFKYFAQDWQICSVNLKQMAKIILRVYFDGQTNASW